MKFLSAVIPAILANDSKRLITIQDISSHFLFTEYDIGENHGIQSTSYKSLYRRRKFIQRNFYSKVFLSDFKLSILIKYHEAYTTVTTVLLL